MNKKIAFVIKASQEFIRHTEKDFEFQAPMFNSLFESISSIYIPLLNMVETLEKDNIQCRFGLVLPPVLCTLLDSESVQNEYINWLDKRNQFGAEELKRNAGNPEITKIINKVIEDNSRLKDDFENKYQKKLVKKYAEYHQKGFIELLATCGTDLYIPHYADLPEIISAQIEVGLQSYRQSFGCFPDGFWLPELGYSTNVEKIIRAYGFSYTILDARSVLLCNQLPSKGIFYPSRTDNSLAIFTNNPALKEMVFGENGFSNNSCYRNENRDQGYELSMDQLESVIASGSPRYSTGFKYWNKSFNDDCSYDISIAMDQVKSDANTFLSKVGDTLTKVSECIPDSDYVVSVFALDAAELKQKWGEWTLWLEEVLRNTSAYDLVPAKCNELLGKQFSLEKIEPYYSSSAGDGYGENLLSSKNCWMMRYVRKASERMVDLADRFPNDTGLKTRLLNLGAKQLLIAQSVGLSKMIENEEMPEYAEKRFKKSISAFTAVFDSLGSNTVSTEWLTKLEDKDSLFPWINYRIFSKKQ